MFRKLVIVISLLLLSAVPPAMGAPDGGSATVKTPLPRLDPDVVKTEVHEDGLYAEFFAPRTTHKIPGLLALGGAEGGLASARFVYAPLADHGYAVLVLAYFRADALPNALTRIPLEYFKSALDWLAARPEVEAGRIGVVGGSKGAEADLLLASHDARIRAVVAASPTNVVWQGLDFRPGAVPHSSWTIGGKDVPFVPFSMTPISPIEPLDKVNAHFLALRKGHEDAIIPVEKIHGSVLLLSGTDDRLWPSTQMGKDIISRLDANHFPYVHKLLIYQRAGHTCCEGDPAQVWTTAMEQANARFGGTPQINAKARAEAWSQTLAFLDAHLKH